MRLFRTLAVTMTLLAGLFTVSVLPAMSVSADTPQSAVCGAIGGTSSGGGCTSDPKKGVDLQTTLKKVINILSVIVGVIAVIMVIVSGLRYVTSGGDSNGVSGAKNALIYALVGLVIVAFAQAIVQFVLHNTN